MCNVTDMTHSYVQRDSFMCVTLLFSAPPKPAAPAAPVIVSNSAPKAGVAIMDSVCCSVLQCVAVCCSVLQCVAVCLQCVAVCYTVLQGIAVFCNVLECNSAYKAGVAIMECVAVCCSVMQYSLTAFHYPRVLDVEFSCVAVCCSVLECVAGCCWLLHCGALCIAVRCSVLQFAPRMECDELRFRATIRLIYMFIYIYRRCI